MLKIGLIGAGMIGKVHADAYSRISSAKLVGIVDVRKDVAEKAAHSLNVPVFDSLEELIKGEDPDVIDICLPTFLHKEYVVKAAQYGKHVFCEKPIAVSADEAKEMIEACEKAGVKFMVGHMLRFSPDYVKTKQMVVDGAVGKVGTVRMIRESGIPSNWNYRYDNQRGSGSVIKDLIVDDFDWLRWTFGDVERIYAKGLQGREDAQMDHVFVSVRMKNGIMAHVTGSWAQPEGFSSSLEVAGQSGVISLQSDASTMPIRAMIRTESKVEHSGESPLGKTPYVLELEHFVESILQNTQPSISGQDAIHSLEISLAALKSIETGRAITL